MPTFSSMDDLAKAYPLVNQGPEDNVYHKAFCFWCHELMGHEYTCWAAIQEFKFRPNKRTAIFIVETWLKPSASAIGMSKDQSILDPINPGSVGSTFTMEKRDALQSRVSGIRSVKSWSGKLSHWGERANLGSVDARTLADMEGVLKENFFDVLKQKPFNTERTMLGSGYYAAKLVQDVKRLDNVPFMTTAMGLW